MFCKSRVKHLIVPTPVVKILDFKICSAEIHTHVRLHIVGREEGHVYVTCYSKRYLTALATSYGFGINTIQS